MRLNYSSKKIKLCASLPSSSSVLTFATLTAPVSRWLQRKRYSNGVDLLQHAERRRGVCREFVMFFLGLRQNRSSRKDLKALRDALVQAKLPRWVHLLGVAIHAVWMLFSHQAEPC